MESFSHNYTLNNQNNRLFPGVIYNWALFERDVRRDVRNCVLFLAFFFVVNITVAAILHAAYVLAEASDFNDPEALNAMISESSGSSAGMLSIVGIVCGSCVFFILRKRRFITDLALPSAELMTPKILIVLIIATQGIQCASSIIATLVDTLLPRGLSIIDSYGEVIDSLFTPLGLVYIVLVGPIFEELVFRGAMLGNLRRFGDNFAIIVSSLLFGFYHMTIMQIPFSFIVGLLLGYVTVRWSIRVAILLHIVTNGLSVLISGLKSEILMGVCGLALIACLIATIAMAIHWRKPLKARIRAGAAYYPYTYINGFSSIALWLFLVVTTVVGIVQVIDF